MAVTLSGNVTKPDAGWNAIVSAMHSIPAAGAFAGSKAMSRAVSAGKPENWTSSESTNPPEHSSLPARWDVRPHELWAESQGQIVAIGFLSDREVPSRPQQYFPVGPFAGAGGGDGGPGAEKDERNVREMRVM